MVITAKVKVEQEVLMAEKDISARIIRQEIMREISNEIERNGNSLLHQRAIEHPSTNGLLYEVKVVVMHPNEYYRIMDEKERLENDLRRLRE